MSKHNEELRDQLVNQLFKGETERHSKVSEAEVAQSVDELMSNSKERSAALADDVRAWLFADQEPPSVFDR